MEARARLKEQAVGTFMVVALVIAAVFIIYFGQGKEWFKKYNSYITTFQTTYNLEEGSPVKILKNTVGKVKSIEPQESGEIKVTLKVAAKYASFIRRDSTVTIDNPTIVGIGTDFVSISRGSPQEPVIANGGVLKGAEKTSVVEYWRRLDVDRDAQIQGLFKLLHNTLVLSSTFERNDAELMKLIVEAEQITRELNKRNGLAARMIFDEQFAQAVMPDLQKIIHNTAIMSDRIVAGKSLAGKFIMDEAYGQHMTTEIDNLFKTAHESQELLNQFGPTIDKFQKVSDRFMGEGMDRIMIILTEMQKVMKDVREISSISRQEADEVTYLIEELNELVKALNRNYLLRMSSTPAKEKGSEELLQINGRGKK